MALVSLRALELGDMEKIRSWRNECLDTLRTPFHLTKEQQEDWYKTEICNRNSRSRFWGITSNEKLVGYGGIENIQWENGVGEISLLISPNEQAQGYGYSAAVCILKEAFDRLNLNTVFGECYVNNTATRFWKRLTEEYNGTIAMLPKRKYCNGMYFDSLYFSVSK
jgi:RimJ/RimL family protein N-acetyltransferase